MNLLLLLSWYFHNYDNHDYHDICNYYNYSHYHYTSSLSLFSFIIKIIVINNRCYSPAVWRILSSLVVIIEPKPPKRKSREMVRIDVNNNVDIKLNIYIFIHLYVYIFLCLYISILKYEKTWDTWWREWSMFLTPRMTMMRATIIKSNYVDDLVTIFIWR